MEKELYIATNNGDMGGGEVMLLNIAARPVALATRSPLWALPSRSSL